MTTIAQGSTATVTLGVGETVTLASNGGRWWTTETPVSGKVIGPTSHLTQTHRTFGPYTGGGTVAITNQTVDTLVYVQTAAGVVAAAVITAVGASSTFIVGDQGTVAVANTIGYWTSTVTPLIGPVRTGTQGPQGSTSVFGPYPGGATVTLNNLTGASLVSVATNNASGTNQSIGGIAIGTVGTGIYPATLKLVDGDEFSALDLISGGNQLGRYIATRTYATLSNGATTIAAGQRAILGAEPHQLIPQYDIDPSFTGHGDYNRGAVMTLTNPASHSIVSNGSGGTALRLHADHQAAGEQTQLNTGVATQVERGSMISMAARKWINNCVLEYKAAIPPTAPAGFHPDLWASGGFGNNMTAAGGTGDNHNEYGFEGNSTISDNGLQTYVNGVFTTNDTDWSLPTRDSAYHLYTVVPTATTRYGMYLDGSLIRNISASPNANGNHSEYPIVTGHVYKADSPGWGPTGFGEFYSAGAWASASGTGADIFVDWFRVWSTTDYLPLTNPTAGTGAALLASSGAGAIFGVTAGTAFTINLPSQLALWGATGLTERFVFMPTIAESPFGDPTTAAYNALPGNLVYDSSGRTLTGNIPASAGSGGVHFLLGIDQMDFVSCTPLHFVVDVAPLYIAETTETFTVGVAVNLDFYVKWDMGDLFDRTKSTAALRKGLSLTGLPSGLSFGTDGRITGTPTGTSTGTITATAVNVMGQSVTQSIPFSVVAAASGVALPALSSVTLAWSGDPGDASKLTTSGGNVTAMAPSDGANASYILANAGTTGPTVASLADGNGNTKTALLFTAANSQFLQLGSGIGLTGLDASFMVIYKPNSTTATPQVLLDLANASSSFTINRYTMVGSASSGWGFRKCDSTGANAISSVGTSITTGVHLLVGRAHAGAAQNAIFNLGTGTAQTSAATSAGPSSLSALTLGNSKETSASVKWADGWWFRGAAWSGYMTDADVASLLAWAQTNYGVIAS